ncbi:porin [Cecembia sp.]|uniref:porin n=1 Tax=Cecembia sp. TaxID=1898110 RepID=UPI0025C2DE29|nr:porin [Cecembia sp.]
MKPLLSFLFSLLIIPAIGQDLNKDNFNFSAYLETYYSYDFNQPDDQNRPDFLYNFSRHNEFSINLAMVKMAYQSDGIRANLALMAGTYAQFNMANEPTWAQFINEASLGVRLHEKLWLDIGVMPSHIGFETWIGAECWHLSRSLLAENSPYFLTGARLSYAVKENIDLTLWASNGWQNVQRVERNRGLGLGFGVTHRPIPGLEINYANYLGNEGIDPVKLWRFFNNFYLQSEVGYWGLTLGTDYGIQQAYLGGINQWYGLTASLRRAIDEKVYVAARAEYYSDPKGIILNEGLKVSGLSCNLDYHYNPSALFRLEVRQFISSEGVFSLPGGRFSKGNTAVTASFSLSF